MHFSADLSSLPFLALYAETHFRFFRLFPSFLYAPRPEVIFDAPRRLAPGRDLPILLIVNDCDRFPAEFSDCAIAVSHQGGGSPCRFDFPDIALYEVEHPLRKRTRAFMLEIPRTALPAGLLYIICRITMRCNGKEFVIVNDNLRTTGKQAFSCFVADGELPGSEFCSYGDLHVHSSYSQSHVEFGPPLRVIDAMAYASGLSFAAITDHSYDLACSADNYLLSDPELGLWRSFQQEFTEAKGEKSFRTLLILGEEVSCLNAKKEVVHLGGMNLRNFIPGTLDGARKNRHKEPQPTLTEAISEIHKQNGLAFAAHPGTNKGFLQRLFLYRGQWSERDLSQDIDAMQIYNSGFTRSWYHGNELWLNMLRRGLKVPVIAGNDAHGDFNRYRFLSVPFLSVGESSNRFFGCGKTGIYGKCPAPEGLVEGIKRGATFVTTGPFAAICSSESPADTVVGKQPLDKNNSAIFIHAASTPEFGALATVEVFAGPGQGSAAEQKIHSRRFTTAEYRACEKIGLSSLSIKPAYLRAEVACVAPGSIESKAFTSAVFLA